MKQVNITITLSMEVPDDWDVVEHPDGILALDMGNGQFMDMTFTPVVTDSANEDATWSTDYEDGFADKILDMVKEYDTEMEVIEVQ
jgi:hypothetical protein